MRMRAGRYPSWVAGAGAAALAALVLFAAAPGDAAAATTKFAPVADSYTSATAPATNYGGASTVRADGSPILNGYLRFDVRGLSDPVKRATLRLYSSSTTSSGVNLRGVTDNGWGEKQITHANAPALGSIVSGSGPFAAGQWISLDATSLVKGDGLVSFGLRTTSTSSKRFSSREVAATSPELVVETEAPPPPPPSPPPGDPVIAAAGDIACDPADPDFNAGAGTASRCRQRAVSDLLVGEQLSAVLPLGDEQYPGGELANFQQSYDPSWGRVRSITRPVVGNHEYATSGAAGYFDYFNGVGNADGPAGPRDKGYYSFEVGNWHLVALNSNCTEVGGCDVGSPQEQWLRSDLAASAQKCTLAYWHHPRFTTDARGPATGMSAIWRALQEANADVVLSGHHHGYERFARQDADGRADPSGGIREFVVGTGGKDLYSFPDLVAQNSGVRQGDTYGVLRLTLRSGGYDWKFVPEAGKTFTDTGSDVCDGPTVDTTSPSVPSGLSARADGPGEVELAWKAGTDDDGVSGYRVLRDGVQIASAPRNTFTDSSAQPSSSYAYEVIAEDPSGNRSSSSSKATVTTPGGSELSFKPAGDTYLRLDRPTTNYGSATTLQVDNSPIKSFLLKFDVSGVGDKPVERALLRLHAVDPSPAGGTFYRVGDTGWGEGSVTWATAPAADPLPLGSLGKVTVGNWYEVDVTKLVTGDGIVGLRVASLSSDGADYASKEATGGLAPELRVTTGSPPSVP